MDKIWNDTINEAFEQLLLTYSERLTGKDDEQTIQMLKVWATFSHIHKTMPHLTRHWNEQHPEAKAAIRTIFEQVKSLHEAQQKAHPTNGNT
ncbi:YusU family protein [Paenibacillus sp. ACRRX]|uniref:DUF2573 family protein n=1 Tax=unclassified Paenibacillus TaxID=185978 RepID=UPI001EF5E5F5|nr:MULTISPECIES: DUF2573 family protein [unclassified Paenibacillus]MCG7410037.1 YusU family protein [Paenibacillus sp. ACRRX]MDK8183987.1 DUF2573 family protein [Paenibacillus sp. UMB4589-SE434]